MSSKRVQSTHSVPSVEQASAPTPQVSMSNAERAEQVRAQRQQERAAEARTVGHLPNSILETMGHKLENPTSTSSRPRMGMSARQKRVEEVAGKADPFMRALEGTDTLDSTHVKASATKKRRGVLNTEAGFTDTDGVVTKDGDTVYGYGANTFGNRPTHQPRNHIDADASRPDFAERLLPNLTNAPEEQDNDGAKSRTGVWSEADVDPLSVVDTGTRKKVGPRNSDRLLHTAADSQVTGHDGTAADVDHRFFVTADHYESAVPVSPVASDYAANNPYTKKYDKDGKTL